MSLRGDIRVAVKELGSCRIKEIQRMVGCDDYHRTYKAVQDLRERGEIVRLALGLYGPGKERVAKAARFQRCMWTVMKSRPRNEFSRAEVAQLAEVSDDYAQKYMTFLKRGGYITICGRRKHVNKMHVVPVYALTAKGIANTQAPKFSKVTKASEHETKRDELLDLAIGLVCAIRAGNYEEAGRIIGELLQLIRGAQP